MRIDNGHFNLIFNAPITLQDLQEVIDRADDYKLPRGARITFITMNTMRTADNVTETSLSLSWRIDEATE